MANRQVRIGRVFVSLFLIAAWSSETIAKDLDVLEQSELTTKANRLLYEHLRHQAHQPLNHRFEEVASIKSPADIAAYQRRRREFFVTQLGGFPEPAPLNAKVVGTLAGDGYRIEKVIFESQPRHHVTATMYLPDAKPPFPCVVVASGHSRTAKAADYNQRFGIIMAKNGMAALVYDPIGQGERSMILNDQGRATHGTTTEHFQMGVGSILLGTNTARYRIWDGMRAIDYAQSRNDIIDERIGFTGCSGGGTLTSYVMALDDRVVCAAPACYLTTIGRLIDTIGPQDAEQNIFGQIAQGMDHPDYVLMRAPRPTIISSTTGDYFDIDGAWSNFRQAKRVYTRLGHPERVDLVEGDGGHGVPIGNLNAIMRWMRRWLLDKDDAPTTTEFEIRELADLQCTPKGQVMFLPGELSVFDLNTRWQKRLAKERQAFWKSADADTARARIRALASIRPISELPPAVEIARGTIKRDGYRIEKLLLTSTLSIPMPALRFVPDQASGDLYLCLFGDGKQAAAKENKMIDRLLQRGHVVMAVDLPGMGETRGERSDGPLGDWKNYFMAYLLGKSLVGIRAEATLQAAQAAKHAAKDKRLHLIATGEAAVAALHAAALSDLFETVALHDTIKSWVPIVSQRETHNQLVNTVHQGLKYYDLPDLVKLHGNVRYGDQTKQ